MFQNLKNESGHSVRVGSVWFMIFSYISDVIFQQDNAPAHTTKTTKTWLGKKSIRLMFWPGQSPDLNPIDNILSHIKHKLIVQPVQTVTVYLTY